MRPALLLLVLGCSSAPRGAPETLATGDAPVAPSTGAYVVYYPDATLVLPTSPEREVQLIQGLLVQDDTGATAPRHAHLLVRERVSSELLCTCANEPEACVLDVTPLVQRAERARGETVVTWNEVPVDELGVDCACFTTASRQHAEDAYDGDCSSYEERATPLSLLGGELVVEVLRGIDDCDGAAAPELLRYPLLETVSPLRLERNGALRCLMGVGHYSEVLDDAQAFACEPPSEEEEDDYYDSWDAHACSLCEAPGDSETFEVLWRGRIHTIASLWSDDLELTSARSERATPAKCPDPSDPCGDPSGLRIPPGASFWVANDGASALVHHGDRWHVLLRGRHAAAVTHARPRGRPIGVRYHADARPLLEEAASGLLVDALSARPTLARPDARDDGACDSDEDCIRAGLCNGYCSAGHQCLYASESCDARHECDTATVCQLDTERCVAPDELRPRAADTLAPADVRYARRAPRDRGRDWARRCHAHIARARFDEAYAACVRALALDPEAAVMASVLRDLALVAEHRRRHAEQDVFDAFAQDYEADAAMEEEEARERAREEGTSRATRRPRR